MTLFYSPSAGGFFDSALHRAMPADATTITRARHRELLAAQAEGAEIVAGPTGKPRALSRPVNAEARREALMRAVKREARRRITAIAPMWRQLNDLREHSEAGAARFVRIDAIRQASDAIEADVRGSAADGLNGFQIASHHLWPESD